MLTLPRWENVTHTLIYLECTAPWTWSDMIAAHQIGYQMCGTVAHRVDFILDMTRAGTSIPDNALMNLAEIVLYPPKNHGQHLLVGLHARTLPMFKSLIATVGRIYDVTPPLAFADTLDEAYRLLQGESRVT